MTRPLHSALITRASPLLRAGPPAHRAPRPTACLNRSSRPVTFPMSLLTFHARAADQAHVTFMPDTAWPASGHPPGSSQDAKHRPGSDVICLDFDTSAVNRLRSSSRSLPDASNDAFSSSLTTTVPSQRSMRRFEITPAGRLRRAFLHLPHSITSSSSTYIGTPFHVRDTHFGLAQSRASTMAHRYELARYRSVYVPFNAVIARPDVLPADLLHLVGDCTLGRQTTGHCG